MGPIDFDAYLDEDERVNSTKRIERKNRRRSQREKRIEEQSHLIEHAAEIPVDVHQHFSPTFQPAKTERAWLLKYLEGFYNDQLITDILWKVKGGKEANVYVCAAHPKTGLDLIAAKVYRPQMFRNLRNDARYRKGRAVLDESGKPVFTRRELLAVRKKTRFGQELRSVSWLEMEFQTLGMLYQAGADVPKPVAHGSNVILMEYFGGDRSPAPTLNQVSLNKAEAKRTFDRIIKNLEMMLEHHRVHADFSAYNVLYWAGQPILIDFPQAVDPRKNPDALPLFVRDIERICGYFQKYGLGGDPRILAGDLWEKHQQNTELDEIEPEMLEE